MKGPLHPEGRQEPDNHHQWNDHHLDGVHEGSPYRSKRRCDSDQGLGPCHSGRQPKNQTSQQTQGDGKVVDLLVFVFLLGHGKFQVAWRVEFVNDSIARFSFPATGEGNNNELRRTRNRVAIEWIQPFRTGSWGRTS